MTNHKPISSMKFVSEFSIFDSETTTNNRRCIEAAMGTLGDITDKCPLELSSLKVANTYFGILLTMEDCPGDFF